jgi:hypothetical protein
LPTDPFVPERLEDEPRQEPNLPPGVKMPPARSWVADRPGDIPAGWPSGKLLGSPGPNIGYALTLANRARDRFALALHYQRRAVVDAIPVDVLRLVPSALPAHLPEARDALQASAPMRS